MQFFKNRFLFILVKKPEDLYLYFIIRSGTDLIGTLTMWITLPKFINKVPLKSLKLKHHFKETLIFFIPTIATSIYHVLDKTLIGLITKDPNENGYYEQAQKLLNIVKALVFSSLNVVMSSRISYLFEENKIEEIKDHIRKSINYILFIGFGCTFGLIGIAARFVPVFFGPGYDKTIILLQVMSPIIILLGVSSCLGTHYYNPAGLRARSAKFLIVGAIVNFILNMILIPIMKSTGAAIGTVFAELVVAVLYVIYSDKYITLKNLLLFSWRKIIASLIMLAVVLYFGNLIKNNILVLVVQVLSGIFVYILILLLLRDPYLSFIMNKLKHKILKK